MQTVNFPCVHCKKMMAVTAEDLGCRVHCPHCQQVVQAPSAPAPASARLGPSSASNSGQENESIFTPPEEAGDDLFGIAPPPPRLEIPPDPVSATTLAGDLPAAAGPKPKEMDSTQTYWLASQTSEAPPAPKPALPPEVAEAPTLSMPLPPEPPSTESAPPEEPSAIRPVLRRPQRSSLLVPMLLIFLIPYSIVVTGAVAYLLYLQQQQRQADPFEKMLDQSKDGAPKRVQHDLPVPNKLKTALNKTIEIGDTAVTPLAIQLNPEGDVLVLRLRIKNQSQNIVFNPLPRSFTEIDRRWKKKTTALPYTFLEFGGGRVYGGEPTYHKPNEVPQDDNPFHRFDGLLRPGEEMTVDLETPANENDRKAVQQATQFQGALLWRLHVRRGFVEARGKEWPASAVIGVEFHASDIQRG